MNHRLPVRVLLRSVGVCALVAAVAVSTLVLSPGIAYACSCSAAPLSEYADDVDVAFMGTEVSRNEYEDRNGWNRAALVFQVGRVYKGDIGRLVEVHTNAGSAACGLYRTGAPAGPIVAYESHDRLRTSWCSSDLVSISEFVEVFGPGYPPDASIELQTADVGSTPVWAIVGIVLGSVVAALTLGTLVVRRRRRQSPSDVSSSPGG